MPMSVFSSSIISLAIVGQGVDLQCTSWCPASAAKPVIVVGGGMSGVTAAAELRRRGCPVKLLEAKDHLGGRTYGVVQDGGWTFNHGANWIHGGHPNPIWDLNENHHLVHTQWLPSSYYTRNADGTVSREVGNDTFVPGQDMRNDFDEFAMNHARFQDWLSLSCQGKVNSLDLPLTYFVSEYIQAKNMSSTERDDFLLYYSVYETLDYAVDLFSASMVNQIARSYSHDKEHMVADPYNVIVEFLGQGLDVVLNEPVSSIQYDEAGVLVRTRSGKTYEGSMVIVTVPIGVLKTPDLTFEPPLPPWKQHTIASMNMGLLEKIAFEFDEPWWEAAGAEEDTFWTVKQGEHAGFKSTASEWYNLHNLMNKTVPPVLLTTPGGYFADYLEYESDESMQAIFMAELQSIFPDTVVPKPKKFLRTFHRQDEFMRGSYFSPAVGTDPLSMAYLAEPVGNRVLFAGEATSTVRFGYADGAHVTGLRAAGTALGLCTSASATIPFDREGLTSSVPPNDRRIRREWKADVESVLPLSISHCDVTEIAV